MERKLKNTILFVGSLFVAIIFLTSYASFGNNSTSNGSTTTTVTSGNAIYVYGNANAMIVNYTYIALINITNSTPSQAINTTLGNMQANGSISNYIPTPNGYEVMLSTLNSYDLYKVLADASNDVNLTVIGNAYITLPATIPMYYSAQGNIPVAFNGTQYTVVVQRVLPINSTVPVKVTALITTTGKIWNDQVKITQA